jgi:hypothetical protein
VSSQIENKKAATAAECELPDITGFGVLFGSQRRMAEILK